MIGNERRRALIASAPGQEHALRGLFAHDPLGQWEFLEADSFSRARFILQYHPCDVLVVDDSLYEKEGTQGLAWLTWHRQIPTVMLVGPHSDRYAKAYEIGVNVCLPRDLALADGTMLAAGLDQAVQSQRLRGDYNKTRDQLVQSRRHVDRLVSILWRSSTRYAEGQWFPQRFMLERLSEEMSRVVRHKLPLTLAIGEMHAPDRAIEENPDPVPDWAANMIIQKKRRHDVAGQYGMGGFMLLMAHTPKDGGLICCKRLQQSLEAPPEELTEPVKPLQAYFGLASLGADNNTPEAMLRMAEESLDAARKEREQRIFAA